MPLLYVKGPFSSTEGCNLLSYSGGDWGVFVSHDSFKWFILWHDQEHPNSVILDGFTSKKAALKAKRALLANEFNVPASR